MRKRRNVPDITAAGAKEAEARAAGEVGARSIRVSGYIRQTLAQVLGEQLRAGAFTSESDAVNQALAAMLGREDLA